MVSDIVLPTISPLSPSTLQGAGAFPLVPLMSQFSLWFSNQFSNAAESTYTLRPTLIVAFDNPLVLLRWSCHRRDSTVNAGYWSAVCANVISFIILSPLCCVGFRGAGSVVAQTGTASDNHQQLLLSNVFIKPEKVAPTVPLRPSVLVPWRN